MTGNGRVLRGNERISTVKTKSIYHPHRRRRRGRSDERGTRSQPAHERWLLSGTRLLHICEHDIAVETSAARRSFALKSWPKSSAARPRRGFGEI